MTPGGQIRPVVYDYGAAPDFLRAISNYLKATSNFSIRQRTQKVPNCSPALVTQVLNGKRRLTRDQLPAFAQIFALNSNEFEYLDKSLSREFQKPADGAQRNSKPSRAVKNHILSHWLHSYVKDLVHLKNFKPDAQSIFKLANGIASPKQIKKSIEFLLREGFWRRNEKNHIVPKEQLVHTTNEIPNSKIRDFHKRALKLATEGIEKFPIDRRKESTVLVSVDKENLAKLRSLIDAFENQLIEFVERNESGTDELIQVTVHMTPVGGNCEK